MYKITLLWANNVYACTYFICSGSSCKSSSFTCKLYVHRWTSGEEYIKIMYVHVHVTIIGHIISQAKLATHTELEPRWVPDWIEGFGADIGSVEGLTKLHLCIVCIQRTLKKHESVQLSCGARYLEIPRPCSWFTSTKASVSSLLLSITGRSRASATFTWTMPGILPNSVETIDCQQLLTSAFIGVVYGKGSHGSLARANFSARAIRVLSTCKLCARELLTRQTKMNHVNEEKRERSIQD